MSEKKIVNIFATWKEEGWGPPGISWSEHVSSRWGGALAGARWGGALASALALALVGWCTSWCAP